MNFKNSLAMFLMLLPIFSWGQVERGDLDFGEQYVLIQKYVKNDVVDLETLRGTTNFLTNRDIDSLNGISLTKRKKAFVRHVKHISEQLEERAFDQDSIDDYTIELLLELEYLKRSMIRKAEFEVNTDPTRKELVSMGLNTYTSNHFFKFKIQYTAVVNLSSSPYWHSVDGKPHKQFGQLADAKKVKARKNMVVLYDGLSRSGSAPKVKTLDLDLDNKWALKWGDELHSDVVASRLFAAVGYDVDHPYNYGKGELTLIFDSSQIVHNWDQLRDSLFQQFEIDVAPFVLQQGRVSEVMVSENKRLEPYLGMRYVQFVKCGLEARPDRVKRLGSFLPEDLNNENRSELRAALLMHAWVGNWDTREQNTLLTTVHEGNYNYRISAVFSDLGTSFGVRTNLLPMDFKVGLVNSFDWEVAKKKRGKVILDNPVNATLTPYKNATYTELKWMALQIAKMDSVTIRKCVLKGNWPPPIAELYFHKLVSRRASILKAFDIVDPHPIAYDRKLTIVVDGVEVVKNGKLKVALKPKENPESFMRKKGRKRNYGN